MAEKEYIEREAALSAQNKSMNLAECRKRLERIPAADVRPVVLCKDCKYYFKDVDGYEMCENSEGYDHVSEDGFCAWAVKREKS